MRTGITRKQDRPDAIRPPVERPCPAAWPVLGEPIALTLTANAGTLIEYRGERLLLDGLHDSRDHAFSRVPPEMLEDIIAGRGIFHNIRALVFTHLHPDHFSASAVRRFAERNPVERIFLPEGDGGTQAEACALRAALSALGTPVQPLDLPLGQAMTFPLYEGMRLTAFPARHAGEAYREVPHYCILLAAGGKHLLFLGDSDYDPAFFSAMLRGVAIHTLVVNPLFINKAAGRKTILEGIRPERVIVNHLPFQEEDSLCFREMIARDLARHGPSLPPTAVLWDALDTITI